jgi:hypothetical protein
MNKYKLPVTWQMIKDIEIEANSLEEAIEKVSQINSQEELSDGKYVMHSFEVQRDFIYEE